MDPQWPETNGRKRLPQGTTPFNQYTVLEGTAVWGRQTHPQPQGLTINSFIYTYLEQPQNTPKIGKTPQEEEEDHKQKTLLCRN